MLRRPLVTALLLVAAACSGLDAGITTATGNTQAPGFPATVIAANGEVVVEERPSRIVSLSPTGTEILFAVGAGEQVVAVDSFSYYPEEAPVTDLSGFEPNLEAIAAYQPDLVLVSDDIDGVVAGVEALDIPVIHHPAAATLEDTYAQIEQLGAVTGHSTEAQALVTGMRAEIDGLVAEVPMRDEAPTYYHELDPTYFTVTSDTFIGQIYRLAGLVNIADAAEDAETSYPQLSAEYIIAANPDLIFLADTKCCGETPETVAARPGWDQITAVRHGGVVPLDDDVASRWGPRVVELLGAAVEAVKALGGS